MHVQTKTHCPRDYVLAGRLTTSLTCSSTTSRLSRKSLLELYSMALPKVRNLCDDEATQAMIRIHAWCISESSR